MNVASCAYAMNVHMHMRVNLQHVPVNLHRGVDVGVVVGADVHGRCRVNVPVWIFHTLHASLPACFCPQLQAEQLRQVGAASCEKPGQRFLNKDFVKNTMWLFLHIWGPFWVSL